MEKIYIEDKVFEKNDYSQTPVTIAEYDNCKFIKCNFQNTDLSAIVFTDCEFNACNFSLAKLNKTGFKNIKFIDCKLTGLHFEHCSEFLFSVSFINCMVSISSFFKLKLKKTQFVKSQLFEIDFSGCDLSQAKFENCDLRGSVFENTNLEKADLSTAINYVIDPEKNRITKAIFSNDGLSGLLTKYDIEIR